MRSSVEVYKQVASSYIARYCMDAIVYSACARAHICVPSYGCSTRKLFHVNTACSKKYRMDAIRQYFEAYYRPGQIQKGPLNIFWNSNMPS